MPVKIPVDRAIYGLARHTDSTFENDIRAYEAENAPTGKIVFYGPSYFTRWREKDYGHRPMAKDLLGASGAECVINRGFGSSCPEHQLYYYPRLIRPLAPSVLVYGAWGNWTDFGYSDEEAFELAERVVAWTRTDFPDSRVYLVAGCLEKAPFPYGVHGQFTRFNRRLSEYAATHENVFFLDPKPAFEGTDESIFADHVHYNQKGYDIYAAFFREALAAELAKF